MTISENANPSREQRRITMFGRKVPMPQSRMGRIAIGIALVIGGILGFLPILGFWMIPLGILVLSYEFASVRRLRRRSVVRWRRWRYPRMRQMPAIKPGTEANIP